MCVLKLLAVQKLYWCWFGGGGISMENSKGRLFTHFLQYDFYCISITLMSLIVIVDSVFQHHRVGSIACEKHFCQCFHCIQNYFIDVVYSIAYTWDFGDFKRAVKNCLLHMSRSRKQPRMAKLNKTKHTNAQYESSQKTSFGSLTIIQIKSY